MTEQEIKHIKLVCLSVYRLAKEIELDCKYIPFATPKELKKLNEVGGKASEIINLLSELTLDYEHRSSDASCPSIH